MKKIVVVLASIFLLQASMAQVRDHRTPKKETKTVTQPVQPMTLYTEGSLLENQQVIIYELTNFTGQSKSFGIGTYQFNTPAEFNDLGSSIKVPNGMIAVVYEHANEAGGYGNYIDLMEDVSDLSVYNFNDKTSYLIVMSASRPGFVYARSRMINNQFVAGHWERIKANGVMPDNSLPAVSSSLEARTPPPVAKAVDESMPVYRIELRIITGTAENEDTDKEVYVVMNKRDKDFFLDYGPNDFELGSDHHYDIISPSIWSLNQIEEIRIGVKGDDMWGIKRVDLYLNNSPTPVFRKSYENSYQINGAGNFPSSIYIDREEIRSNNYWKAIPDNAELTKWPVVIPYSMLKSMVESMVGNQIHQMNDKKLHWGNTSGVNTLWGEHVEGSKTGENTLHFDLDLEYEVDGINPEIDLDFDMEFTCYSSGAVGISIKNVKIGCEVLGTFNCEGLYRYVNAWIYIFGGDPTVDLNLTGGGGVFSNVFKLTSMNVKCKGVQINGGGNIFIR